MIPTRSKFFSLLLAILVAVSLVAPAHADGGTGWG